MGRVQWVSGLSSLIVYQDNNTTVFLFMSDSDQSYGNEDESLDRQQSSGSQESEAEEGSEDSHSQSGSAEDFQYQHPEQELEKSILQQLHPSQLTGKFRDKICEDIEQKISELETDIQSKTEEEVIEIRSIQLAKTKILVMVHDWSPFRLVVAYTRLGIAYMDYDCNQQAEEHLSSALKRNKQYLDEIERCKIYNAYISTSLAKCHYEKKDYQMALDYLQQSREIELDYPKEEISSLKTLMLMSNCFSKLKDFENANRTIDELIILISEEIGDKSAECAMAFIEKAKISSLEGNFEEAENYQNRGIQSLIDINYKRPEFVAEAYQILAQYQQKLNNPKEQINSLQKAKTICEQVFSRSDKRVIKLKRQIAVVLLKNENHQEALKELGETLELEKKVYGENSIQVGKTLKLIGTIYMTMQMADESKEYLRQAQRILGEKKPPKAPMQSKTKLRYVKQIRQNRKIAPKSFIKK